jgi:hypothetical protein
VVNEYAQMVAELTSGVCVAVEVSVCLSHSVSFSSLSLSVCLSLPSPSPPTHIQLSGFDDPQQRFRELCGPPDPEVARHIRQNTLRAKYGRNRVQNAVHCTDLPDDAALEVSERQTEREVERDRKRGGERHSERDTARETQREDRHKGNVEDGRNSGTFHGQQDL